MLSTVLFALPLLGGPTTQAPTLTHTAPWLGQVMWLELTGLEPGTPYTLWASTAAASLPFDFGTIEIDPASAVLLFATVAVPPGGGSLPLFLPADPALAELPLHLQAVATGAQTPTGIAVSNGVHLRLLGSRVHAYQERVESFSAPPEERVRVLAGGDLEPVFDIALSQAPGWLGMESVHLSPNASFAALALPGPAGSTTSQILRFEHFFASSVVFDALEVRGDWFEAPWGGAWIVYARATSSGPWQLWSLPYDPAEPPTPLGIVGGSGYWTYDPLVQVAWIPDAPTPANEPRLRGVSLFDGSTLDSVVVGLAEDVRIDWADLEGERLIVGTSRPFDIFVMPWPTARMGWVDTLSDPGTLHSFDLFGFSSRSSGRLEASGRLLVWGRVAGESGPFFDERPYVVDPTDPAAATEGSEPTGAFMRTTSVEDLGTHAWVLDPCCDDPPDLDGPASLWLLDPGTGALVPNGPPLQVDWQSDDLYASMAATRGIEGEQVLLGSNCVLVPVCGSEQALKRIDPQTGSVTYVSTGQWETWWLDGVSPP